MGEEKKQIIAPSKSCYKLIRSSWEGKLTDAIKLVEGVLLIGADFNIEKLALE